MTINIKRIDKTDYYLFKSQLKRHGLTITGAFRIFINQIINGSILIDSQDPRNKHFKPIDL